MQWAVDTFPKKDVVQILISLKELHARDLRQSSSDLFRRCSRGDAIDTKHANVELTPICPLLINRKEIGFTTSAADCSQAGAIEVFDHCYGAGFNCFWRRNRQFCCDGTNAGLVNSTRLRVQAK